MPELTILEGQGAGLRVPLSPDQAYTIGSGDDDSIPVAGVGPSHLIVKALKSGGFGIKGLNGPFRHNGKPAEAARLADGDRIDIGSIVLGFRDAAHASIEDVEDGEEIIKPRSARKTDATASRAADAGSARPAKPAAAASGEPPRELGGHRLIEVLGKGGMGIVYRAEQVSLSREVALKVLSDKLTKDPVFVERFVAEARAAARLHHPNVVQVFDVDQVGDASFYSMELMHKGSVEDLLKRSGKLGVDHAISIITDAAQGLGFAESLRIVHRDIKPDNLMIDQHDHVKIADLGLAMSDDGDQGGRVLGTPHFMPPEQIQRQPLDHRSDLYALGCTFFRLVTGQTPFSGGNVKEIVRHQVKTPAPLAHDIEPSVPTDVSAIIAKMLEKAPADRFQSADELLAALGEVQAPPSRKGLLIGGLAAAVAIAGGAVWYAATRPEGKTETVTVRVSDPDAEAAAAASNAVAAESRAQAAYYRVQARSLQGLSKADALDAVAAEHSGTEFGTKSSTEADEIRQAVANARAAEEQRKAAVTQAGDTLRGAFEQALAKSDFKTADGLLSLQSVPEALRTEPEISALKGTLSAALATAGTSAITELKAKLDAAINSREAGQIDSAADQLAAIIKGPGAWPALALGDPGPLERVVSDARVTLKSVQSSALQALEGDSWTALRAAVLADGGVAEALQGMDPATAAAKAGAFAKSAGPTKAATHMSQLAAAYAAAGAYAETYTAAVEAGSMTFGEGDDALRGVRFVRSGSDAGLVLKTGGRRPKESRRDLDALRNEPLSFFPSVLTEGAPAPQGRAAFIASILIADQLERSQTYLATVSASADASGVGGYQAASADLFASELSSAVSATQAEWKDALTAELEAARSIDRALRAFSEQRNLAAARLLDRTLKAANETSIVQCLR